MMIDPCVKSSPASAMYVSRVLQKIECDPSSGETLRFLGLVEPKCVRKHLSDTSALTPADRIAYNNAVGVKQ
jgi:hypothetical protein